MAEKLKKIEEKIFYEALTKSPGQRDAFLRNACGEDQKLYNRVEALLQANDVKDNFLQSPVLDSKITLDNPPHIESPGTVIGRYKLLEKIGEGGMAVVYMAEQEKPIRRQVALKIIKLGMDTKSVIARFEAERQALALMDHPHIARVFDAGATETGRPYFVMELVRGLSITEYCDQNNLNTEERQSLFIQVCSAVQHAHQKGIIHRDIKPTNVMVTKHEGRPIPKVIDFGIAKATNQRLTEKTLFTRYAQMIGTPAYMSPEQAEMSDLDIDTRTDIYSLGVLLYELLTGTPPFSEEELRQAGYLEIQRIIREQEPTKPSTKLSTLGDTLAEVARQRGSTPGLLRKSVRGDLDWIVMKALEKQRNRRYDTAAELAADINRHLNNEPVQAAAPGFLYRARKFARRHRIGVLVTLLVSLAICVILSALSVSTVLIWREQGRTRRAFEKEQKALKYETQARMLAERQTRISQAVVDFLNNDLLASVDPSRALGRQVMVIDVLNAASENIKGRFQNEPLVEASIRRTLGSTYKALGNYTAAEAHYERNLYINIEQLGQEHNNTLTSMGDLAELYRLQGKLDQAESLYEKLLEISPRVLGAEHPHTLVFMNNFALVCHQKGRHEQAEELYLKTLEIRKQQLGEEHPNTLACMNNLGGLYYDMGQYQKAETIQLETLEIHKRVLGREHPDTLMLMSNIAALYMAQGKYEKAKSLFLTILPIQKRVMGAEHPGTMTTTNNLAHVYRYQKRHDQAEPLYEQVLEVNTRKLGEEHQYTMATMNNLGELYRAQKRYDESEELHTRAYKLKVRVLGREHPDTLAAMNNLAGLYQDQSRYDDAEKMHLETLEISKRLLGEEHPNTLSTMNNLAMFYMFQHEFQKAETLHLRTFELRQQVLRPGHPYTVRTIRHLVDLYTAWDKPEEAQKWRTRLSAAVGETETKSEPVMQQ